jgi:hypothetical protein
VPVAKHEPIAIVVEAIFRSQVQVLKEQCGHEIGHAQRAPGVTTGCGVNHAYDVQAHLSGHFADVRCLFSG